MITPYQEEQAVRDLLGRLSEAWRSGDAEAMGALFTEDCDYVTFDGTHLKGREDNVAMHRTMLRGFFFRGSRLESREVRIRFLNDTTALVHSVGALLLRWQKTIPANRLSINTTVLVRQDGRWLITAFHNCRIKPMGRFAKWMMSI